MEELTRTASGGGVRARLGGLFPPARQPSASARPERTPRMPSAWASPRPPTPPARLLDAPQVTRHPAFAHTHLPTPGLALGLPAPHQRPPSAPHPPSTRLCPPRARQPWLTLSRALSPQVVQELLTLPTAFCAASSLHSGAASSRKPPLIFPLSPSGGPIAPSLPTSQFQV